MDRSFANIFFVNMSCLRVVPLEPYKDPNVAHIVRRGFHNMVNPLEDPDIGEQGIGRCCGGEQPKAALLDSGSASMRVSP